MKFLIDTNIILPIEPGLISDFEVNTDLALKFYRLSQESGNNVCVHPEVKLDLQRDKNIERSELRKKLINRYEIIKSPPPITLLEKECVGDPVHGSNDYVDNCLLASVKGDAVDFLITEDKKLHRKAQRSGLESRVLFLQDAIILLLNLFDHSPPPPPSVKQVFVYELNEKDSIFNTLRKDYSPKFDSWLTKCKRIHREAYIIQNEKLNHLSGICIFKNEDKSPTGDIAKTLKLCTFKISEFESGKRYGELLFKAVFDYADSNNYDYIYFTAFPKQDDLIAFSESFGFFILPQKNKNGEFILYKKLSYNSEDAEEMSPLEFHIKYGPRHVLFYRNNTFLIPIKPLYHQALFPELESQQLLFHDNRPCGNSIKKAYLSHSLSKQINSGDNIFFYRSGDVRGITAIGFIEDIIRTTNSNKIARHVGSRTVYDFKSITEFCKRPTLVIRFRYVKGVKKPIRLKELKNFGVIKDAPQSIIKLEKKGIEWIRERLNI